ncbi:MAG: hypothetical protein ACOVOV_19455, partial [Dolichospermum sp.]
SSSIVINGGTLTIGVGGFNRRLTSTGTLTVSAGTLNINGNLSIPSGTFNQSGGNIYVDGNNEGVNDVASGTVLVSFGSGAANNGTVTGGNLYIIDPPFSGTARSLELNFTSGTWQWGAGHTTYFGDGTSTNTSSNTSGFQFDTYVGSASTQSMIGSVVVNGGSATNRWVTTTSASGNGSYVKGSITINANSELRDIASGGILVVAGNIVNNGTLTKANTGLTFGDYTGTSLTAATNSQIVSGSGTFRNSLSSTTAWFTTLTVNNSSSSGVTVAAGLVPSVSGTTTITTGKFNADTLALTGSSAQAVALTAAASEINVQNFRLSNAAGVTFSGS